LNTDYCLFHQIEETTMSNIAATLTPGVRFELAFASVIPGKEVQLFSEYFPQVGPIVAELGATQIASFAILESAADIKAPTMGALFKWSTVDAYLALHKDPRFLAVKHLRDDALSRLWNGHFFAAETPISVGFDTGKTYAVVVAPSDVEVADAEMSLNLAPDSTNKDYVGRVLSIAEWSPATQSLLVGGNSKVDIFKVKFNPPNPAATDGGE
jgi:hypothetical protein